MPREPEITWVVPIDKANMILSIIGQRPFVEVADLINDLRQQAASQMQGGGAIPPMGEPPRPRANGAVDA